MLIDGININYIQYGEGKDVVLLHGWGQNIEMMKFLGDQLKDVRVTILDLPGFGNTSEPPVAWSVDDYTNLFEKFLNELNITNPILVGHSFGGRIAIKYASKNDVDKLVLFGTPCIRKETKQPLKVKLYKILKHTIIGEYYKNMIGSKDYLSATETMRNTLVKVVNEDLSNNAKDITSPTLLIWGDNDEAVPIEMAKELVTIMQDAALIELKGSHYAYIENLNQVSIILNTFFKQEKVKDKNK